MKFLRGRQVPWFGIAAAGAVFLAVGAYQIYSHAYRSNFAEHPDEAAHFVSALCVLDYFRTAPGTNPVRFAESYYVHYPKVALGHWPPLFYALQAIWYAVTGPSSFQAILLAGVTAALTGLILLLRFQRLYGKSIALLAAGVFLWLPLVRASELMLMSDLLACLFMLLAIFAFCDACSFHRTRDWILLALWSSLGILTKESALILIVVVPVALLGVYGKQLFASRQLRRVILATGAILLLLFGLYAAGGVLRVRGVPLLLGPREAWRRLPALLMFPGNASPVFLLIGAVAIFGLLRAGKSRSSEQGVHSITAVVWLTATLVCQPFLREAFEPRYLLPAFLAAVILFAGGLSLIGQYLARLGKSTAAVWAAVAIAAACLVSTPPLRMHQRSGYSDVAASIPDDPEGQVVLVSSDEMGEGAMVAELLLDDPAGTFVVLRGTKVLSSSDWLGRDNTLLVQSPEAVLQILNSTPVHYVVVDMNGFIRDVTRPHHRLLEEAIRDYPAQFRLAGNFPLYFDGHRREDAVQVYENLAARGQHAQTIHVRMTRTLGRDLDVPLIPAHNMASRRVVKKNAGPAPADVAPTDFSIAPENDSVPASGAAGRIYITSSPGHSWSLQNVPDWIGIQERHGSGDRVVTYEVAENRSNARRSAAIAIGDDTFSVTQPRSVRSYPPLFEDFPELLSPAWSLHAPDPTSTDDPPSQWVLDDQSGAARLLLNRDNGARRGLILDKSRSEEAWKTRISLAGIELEPDQPYRAAIWMKAENPQPVWLTLRTVIPPNTDCGLSEEVPVTGAWREYHFVFRPKEACGGGNSRFSLEAGKIVGRLWFGQFSLTEPR